MKKQKIFYFKENIKFRFSDGEAIAIWIEKIVRKEKHQITDINFIFCNDVYLKNINKEYLGHNYFTDIVTFDNSLPDGNIIGDIFISIDRVIVNAKKFGVTFNDELHRVMAHGVLHLLGYGDKSRREKEQMRKMEDYWLARRNF
jgi:probable rRNA maturation factor